MNLITTIPLAVFAQLMTAASCKVSLGDRRPAIGPSLLGHPPAVRRGREQCFATAALGCDTDSAVRAPEPLRRPARAQGSPGGSSCSARSSGSSAARGSGREERGRRGYRSQPETGLPAMVDHPLPPLPPKA